MGMVCYTMGGYSGERERERQKERDRQKQIDGETERDRLKDRKTEMERKINLLHYHTTCQEIRYYPAVIRFKYYLYLQRERERVR